MADFGIIVLVVLLLTGFLMLFAGAFVWAFRRRARLKRELEQRASGYASLPALGGLVKRDDAEQIARVVQQNFSKEYCHVKPENIKNVFHRNFAGRDVWVFDFLLFFDGTDGGYHKWVTMAGIHSDKTCFRSVHIECYDQPLSERRTTAWGDETSGDQQLGPSRAVGLIPGADWGHAQSAVTRWLENFVPEDKKSKVLTHVELGSSLLLFSRYEMGYIVGQSHLLPLTEVAQFADAAEQLWEIACQEYSETIFEFD